MHHSKRFFAVITFALTVTVAQANTSFPEEIRSADREAKATYSQVMQLNRVPPIESPQELAGYMEALPEGSPLGYLSDAGRRIFLESLTFTELGLASFNYRFLKDELTPSQIARVLGLFGLADRVFLFDGARVETEMDAKILSLSEWFTPQSDCNIRDYECEPPATCDEAMNKICIACNCGMQIP